MQIHDLHRAIGKLRHLVLRKCATEDSGIRACTALQCVVACITGEPVIAGTAIENIAGDIADELVGT